MSRVPVAFLVVGVLSLLACAHLREDAGVCPEYRDLRCATAPECSMDRQRGCRVCACSQPYAPAATYPGRLPTTVAPDQRTPQQ